MNRQNVLKNAVIPSVIAFAALALSTVIPFNADTAVGAFTVASVLAIAALEYGYELKRLPGKR